MNSLLLISPYKGEALNQFFLVKGFLSYGIFDGYYEFPPSPMDLSQGDCLNENSNNERSIFEFPIEKSDFNRRYLFRSPKPKIN